jgi:hypothetical protein
MRLKIKAAPRLVRLIKPRQGFDNRAIHKI